MLEMTPDEFDALVGEALDELPDELAGVVENLAVLVLPHAPEDDPDLLGLYDGVPLTAPDGVAALPAQILIFRENLMAMCQSRSELADEVRITVVHEVAHHFGIDDQRLHELGYA